eukprot:scaffold39207_cov72-Phaeocystis_antarctica.AAC.1
MDVVRGGTCTSATGAALLGEGLAGRQRPRQLDGRQHRFAWRVRSTQPSTCAASGAAAIPT